MKTLFLLSFIGLSLIAKAQSDSSLIKSGQYLQKYAASKNTALILTITGGAAMFTGTQVVDEVRPLFYGVGGIMLIIGTITNIAAPRWINKAGKELEFYGNGLKIKF